MAVHANCMPEVIDLIKTQLAVQVEEYDAVLYREVWMCSEVPNINQILVVQQEQCIPDDHCKHINIRTE